MDVCVRFEVGVRLVHAQRNSSDFLLHLFMHEEQHTTLCRGRGDKLVTSILSCVALMRLVQRIYAILQQLPNLWVVVRTGSNQIATNGVVSFPGSLIQSDHQSRHGVRC